MDVHKTIQFPEANIREMFKLCPMFKILLSFIDLIHLVFIKNILRHKLIHKIYFIFIYLKEVEW